MNDTTYYVVKGGAAHEVMLRARELREGYLHRVETLRNRLGAEQGVHQGPQLVGFVFCDDGPVCAGGTAWRPGGEVKGRPWYMPVRRSKAGKALAAEMESIRDESHASINEAFLGDSFGWFCERGGRDVLRTTSVEKVGTSYIVGVPTECDHEPPDGSHKLQMSEYWRLKEGVAE